MENFLQNFFTQVPAFMLAIAFHEAAHAYVAYKFGDNTAKSIGRLTLNPMAHIDIFGTIIFPVILMLSGLTAFGWAKPVPVDFRNFKNIRKAQFWVSFGGPLSNFMLAIISAFLFALVHTQVSKDFYLFDPFVNILNYSVVINIVLGVFNLIPFPPLDGSRMVSAFMDYNTMRKFENLSRYFFLFMIVCMFTGIVGHVIRPFLILANQLTVFFYQIFV